ncbi:MAG: hypothetical protein ABW321_05155 [Polyangiales bacterium]
MEPASALLHPSANDAIRPTDATPFDLATPRLRRAAAYGVSACLILGVFKGLVTSPHSWGITHHMLNYSHGFVKRGLFGTLLYPLYAGKNGTEVRELIVGVTFITLALFAVVAGRAALALVARSGTTSHGADLLVAALFTSSAYVWNTALGLGYLDALVGVLAFIAVRNGKLSLGWFVPIAVVSLLVHEITVFVLVPLLLLLPLSAAVPGRAVDRRQLVRTGLVVALFAVGAALVFTSRPTWQLNDQMVARGAVDADGVEMVTDLMNDTLATQLHAIHAISGLHEVYLRLLFTLFPTNLAMLLLGWVQLQRSSLPRPARRLWALLYVLTSVGAMVLVLCAYDFARVFAQSQLQGFLAYCVLRHKLDEHGPDRSPAPESRLSLGVSIAAALIVVANVLTPAGFTFFPPRPRFQPQALERVLIDPLHMRELEALLQRIGE